MASILPHHQYLLNKSRSILSICVTSPLPIPLGARMGLSYHVQGLHSCVKRHLGTLRPGFACPYSTKLEGNQHWADITFIWLQEMVDVSCFMLAVSSLVISKWVGFKYWQMVQLFSDLWIKDVYKAVLLVFSKGKGSGIRKWQCQDYNQVHMAFYGPWFTEQIIVFWFMHNTWCTINHTVAGFIYCTKALCDQFLFVRLGEPRNHNLHLSIIHKAIHFDLFSEPWLKQPQFHIMLKLKLYEFIEGYVELVERKLISQI